MADDDKGLIGFFVGIVAAVTSVFSAPSVSDAGADHLESQRTERRAEATREANTRQDDKSGQS